MAKTASCYDAPQCVNKYGRLQNGNTCTCTSTLCTSSTTGLHCIGATSTCRASTLDAAWNQSIGNGYFSLAAGSTTVLSTRVEVTWTDVLYLSSDGTDLAVLDGNRSTSLFKLTFGGTLGLFRMHLKNGKANIDGCSGDDCYGGAVYLKANALLDARFSFFSGNLAESGGAIYASGSDDAYNDAPSTIHLIDSNFTGNMCANSYELIDPNDANPSYIFSKLSGNGGAIKGDSNVHMSIVDGLFLMNQAYRGAAVDAVSSFFSATGTTFSTHVGRENTMFLGSTPSSLTNITFHKNIASHGLHYESASHLLQGCQFLEHRTLLGTLLGGGVAGDGGAIFFESLADQIDSVRIEKSIFIGNMYSPNVAGEYNTDPSKGGAIQVESNSLTLEIIASTFIGNAAIKHGGAIYIKCATSNCRVDNYPTLIVNDTTFTNNTVVDKRLNRGGAIYAESTNV